MKRKYTIAENIRKYSELTSLDELMGVLNAMPKYSVVIYDEVLDSMIMKKIFDGSQRNTLNKKDLYISAKKDYVILPNIEEVRYETLKDGSIVYYVYVGSTFVYKFEFI